MKREQAMYSRIFMIIVCTAVISVSVAAEEGELIINPKLEGGIGAFPIRGSKIVRRDTLPENFKPQKTTKFNFQEMYPDGVEPVGLLITGKVPYPSRRWVVAVTRDEEEFNNSFTQYRNLVRAGKGREAFRALHLARNIAVGTKVIRKDGSGSAENVPEKVGSFFFDMSIRELEKHGGYLTFLSYEPSEQDDVVPCALDIEKSTVHGAVLVEKVQDNDPELVDYRMKILRARITDSYRPGKLNQIVKVE